MKSAIVLGAYRTDFGKFPGKTTLEMQVSAALGAASDASLSLNEVDAVIVGYSTTAPHLMPANLLAEAIGARPSVAFGMNAGGCTGLSMVSEAARLVRSGVAKRVLVVGGENRATGQSRESSTATLAQVADQNHEVPIGATVPALYGLLASEYYARRSLPNDDLVDVAVQMRANAAMTPGAHFTKPVSREEVAASRIVAHPLRILECSPVSDGAAAVLIGDENRGLNGPIVEIVGTGSANRAQHVSSLNFDNTGAGESAYRATREARMKLTDFDLFGIYDSFTVTLAMILEEIGFVPPGETGELARSGAFSARGGMPLNLHGGLLSYGHSGVAGGLVHFTQAFARLRADRALGNGKVPRVAYLHGDGGIMSAHASLVLERTV